MFSFDATATRAALPFERLIPALRAMFASGCVVPARQMLDVAASGEPPVTSLLMPAWLPGRRYGVKVVNVAPGNAERGLPGLHATYLLFDAATGVPLATIDGNQITARRTAAASALAADFLARPEARHLLVVGAGQVARLLPEAYRVVRSIERVTVWARQHKQARALAAHLRQAGFDADAALSLEAAAAEADIVSCATMATAPLVFGHWLRAGSHLDLIGSYRPDMREADDHCFAGAEIYVDTDEALAKSGDLLGPLSRGVFTRADVRGTLAALARGDSPGREALSQRTVFKSVGTALEDLAAAMLVEASRPG